jgi:predicted dehydrogenase
MQEPLRVQDEHFVDCARSGRRPRSDGESGLAVVRILEAAARSLERGSALPLADGTPAERPGLAQARQDLARSRA